MKKTEGQYCQAIKELYKANEGHPQYQTWLDYALNTNLRGEFVVEQVRPYLPGLKGKRHLDIGCGYGGTCISFAREGSLSTGIDIDSGLLKLAGHNLADHPDQAVDFQQIDCMSWKEICPLGEFDIITCDNVIEHVDVPERLIAHIRMLLKPDGIAYLSIPNGFSIGQIRKDCHYGQFGVVFLNPIDGRRFVWDKIQQTSYDVSYFYPYGYYEEQFEKYNFSSHLINGVPDTSEAHFFDLQKQVSSLISQANHHFDGSHLPDDVLEKIFKYLDHYEKRFETDLNYMRFCDNSQNTQPLATRLVRDYEIELWYVILSPAAIKKNNYFLKNYFRRARRKAFRMLSSLITKQR